MTTLQQSLIDSLAGREIEATWNGNWLNCRVAIKSGSKTKPQRFAFVFDEPAELLGARRAGKMTGAYSEAFARDVFHEIIRLGQGQGEADKFAAECREAGLPVQVG